MNNLFRTKAINEIRSMIDLYKSSFKISHPGIKGRSREDLLLIDILKKFLPLGVDLTTDQIITDCEGAQSKEVDGIVYTKKVLSPLTYITNNLIIPIESVIYTFEIKSLTSNTSIIDALDKASSVQNLKYSAQYSDMGDSMAYFSYKSDLKSDSKEEIKRFVNNQSDFLENPLIPAICIIGRGYWYNERKNNKWYFVKNSDNFDEVISFLAHVINSVSERMEAKTPCLIGPYLIDDIAEEFNIES